MEANMAAGGKLAMGAIYDDLHDDVPPIQPREFRAAPLR
jgi:hypothetical protein